MQRRDLVGQTIGRWSVMEWAGASPSRWVCRCTCGAERIVLAGNLTSGKSLSCGCYRNELSKFRSVRHGQARLNQASRIYRIWTGILTRVSGTSKPHHRNYKNRGIDMDPRWRSFETFLADMGDRPSRAHSIDRVDNSRGYWPDNCRWATNVEQARNRRSNRLFTHDGVTAPVAAWAERTGLTSGCIIGRLNSGKTGADVVAPMHSSRVRKRAA